MPTMRFASSPSNEVLLEWNGPQAKRSFIRSELCVSGFADTQFPNESKAGIELLLRSDNFHDIYQKLHKLNELAKVVD